ncbi:hypothetical protein MPSEU_000604100 [Mayamaea pseudoterrestris]|nr:hypothetical protein MPSEU_000604100 [Mayamaea pseudoterrestris]
MTEFNKKAFSVVDKFFEDDADPKQTSSERAVNDVTSSRPQTRKEHRFGVGAAPQPPQNDRSKVDLHKRILQVGGKRGAQQQAEDDEVDNHSDEEYEEEEDVGRTSIAEPLSKKQKPFVGTKESRESSQRKKDTRKNSKATKADFDAHAHDTIPVESAVNINDFPSADGLGLVIDRKGVDPDSVLDNGDAGPAKRKRKKVRSKQKNIYKDKREKKPDHLIPGSKNYKGKPLTAETKKKLNLPTK